MAKAPKSSSKQGVRPAADLVPREAGVVTGGKTPETSRKQLEAQDKLGNFEIQNLMSTYNQAETL